MTNGFWNKNCIFCNNIFYGNSKMAHCSEYCYYYNNVIVSVDDNKCWLWTGYIAPNHYGVSCYNKEILAAHRRSYRMFNGVLLPNLVIMHICDNPPCVNPKHLIQDTQANNMKDCKSKKRFANVSGSKNRCAKLNESQVIEIYNSCSSIADLAIKFNVGNSTINAILTGQNWSHLTNHISKK